MSNNTAVANILDDFNQYNHSLIFLTSALRSMFETGNVNVANIEIGVFNYMSELSDGFIRLEKSVQQLISNEDNQATSTPAQDATTKQGNE